MPAGRYLALGSPLRAEAFTQPYAGSLGVLHRVDAHSVLIPGRYPASLGQISRTGLVTPVFAASPPAQVRSGFPWPGETGWTIASTPLA